MEIAQQRLINQGIQKQIFNDPAEIVKWLGAVQAQDYYGSLWAIGLRGKKTLHSTAIESAIAEKKIIRTWPMRHTLHFVSPEDIRWMLKWLNPRVNSFSSARMRELEIDEQIISKSRKIFIKALGGTKQITRNGMYQLLEDHGISSANQRGIHILGELSIEGLLCFGVREGKQFTFTLLDEWVPPAPELARDEALAELARKYFHSHGPATVQDFAWWTGLSLTDCRKIIASLNKVLYEYKADNTVYWHGENNFKNKTSKNVSVFLLPAFDEYLVSYKDRRAAISTLAPKLSPFSLLSPTVIINGLAAGTWNRELIKDKVKLTIKPFYNFNKEELSLIEKKVHKYCKSLNSELYTLKIV